MADFTLPLTPLQSPSPYTHSIDIRNADFRLTSDVTKGMILSKDYLSLFCHNAQNDMVFYRNGGRVTMKAFTSREISTSLSDEDSNESFECNSPTLIRTRPELYEEESFALERLTLEGFHPMIIYGTAIAKKQKFELHLNGNYPIIQFRDFDCESVIVYVSGPFFLSVGSCLTPGERHSFTFVPRSHISNYGQCIIDTSAVLDNQFSINLCPEHNEGQKFTLFHKLSKRMVLRCRYVHRSRATKYDLETGVQSMNIHAVARDQRDRFDEIEELPYVDPLKAPARRHSLRIRDKKKQLQENNLVDDLPQHKRRIYGY